MRTFARYALTIGAAASLLAACSGFQPQIVAPRSASASRPFTSGHYSVLYSFNGGSDAALPSPPDAPLILSNGSLYGTTGAGGGGGGSKCYNGCGTVFQVSTMGAESVLYRFQGVPDGQGPGGTLTKFGRKWYGVTASGGSNGNGAVFALDQSGSEHLVYSFKGGSDGMEPFGQLVVLKGTLYGTTDYGGQDGLGTVFALTPSGNKQILHSFKYRADGAHPAAALTLLGDKLYGTTTSGGKYTLGSVFSITTSGKERVLYSFQYGTDGAVPGAALIAVAGKLYGTTVEGGGQGFAGTVFDVSPSGVEQILHRFKNSLSDGQSPESVLLYHNGKLYGTTSVGGRHGDGIIFALTSSGKERVLYHFSGSPDGKYPTGGLTAVNNTLYGTTSGGGTGPCFHNDGCGTIFALTP